MPSNEKYKNDIENIINSKGIYDLISYFCKEINIIVKGIMTIATLKNSGCPVVSNEGFSLIKKISIFKLVAIKIKANLLFNIIIKNFEPLPEVVIYLENIKNQIIEKLAKIFQVFRRI